MGMGNLTSSSTLWWVSISATTMGASRKPYEYFTPTSSDSFISITGPSTRWRNRGEGKLDISVGRGVGILWMRALIRFKKPSFQQQRALLTRGQKLERTFNLPLPYLSWEEGPYALRNAWADIISHDDVFSWIPWSLI